MWSSVAVPGAPRILMVDTTRNVQGWEHDFFDRLSSSLRRSELEILGNPPLRLTNGSELPATLSDFDFNCLVLFGHADSEPDSKLSVFWDSLRSEPNLPPFLLAVCSSPNFDPQVTEDVLKSTPPVTPLAIAPLSPMAPREAGLFYLKFFTELKLHSADSISGKMVWFSFSKARELLRRRRYSARFGVRC